MTGAVAPLAALAERINAEHAAAHDAARSAIEHAVACGRLLIEAKAQVAHGEWLPWLEAHTTVSVRQSQRYMKLAEGWERIEVKNDAASHLTIDGALKLLAAPAGERVPLAPSAKPREPLGTYGSPTERARTCRRWPDIRDFAAMWLAYEGWDEAQTAAYLGLDVREIEAALYPAIDPSWLRGENNPEYRLIEQAVQASAEQTLAFWRAGTALSCAGHAYGLGDDSARRYFIQVEREATRLAARRQRQYDDAAAELDALAAAAAWSVGLTYARAAAGLEPREGHVLWFEIGEAVARIEGIEQHAAALGYATASAMPAEALRPWFDEDEERLRAVRIPTERLGEASYEELLAEHEAVRQAGSALTWQRHASEGGQP